MSDALQEALDNARAALGTGDLPAAERWCRQALDLNPDSATAWNELGRALNNQRRLDEARDAFLRSLKLQPGSLAVRNNLGHVLRARGDLEAAAEQFRLALEDDPESAPAQHNLGVTCLLLGRVDEAIYALTRCTELVPGDTRSLVDLGVALHTAGRFAEAISAYRKVLATEPEHAEAWLNLGLVYVELRDTAQAEKAFHRALALQPDDPLILAELAALYEESNRMEEAGEVIERALRQAPGHPRLALEAAKLDRRAGRIREGLQRLRRIDLYAVPQRLAQQVHFELGYLCDRDADPDAAMRHFQSGNDLARRNLRMGNVNPQRYLDKLDRLYRFYTATAIGEWCDAPAVQRPEPVFLVGFPRSGTTLTDLVLDSHPRLHCIEEKPTINKVEAEVAAMASGYPEALAELDAAEIVRLREVYYAEVERHADLAPDVLLVDKMPIRTVHAGLIWRLFPGARIVFAVRHPCDVILSGFMQQYALNDAFANFFTLEEAVRVYDKVMRLWQLYTERLPLAVHFVRYEDLVEDLDGEAGKLLRFIGVPWNDAVCNYRQRALERGRVNTNSYHQVTEPLYTRARYRWERYRRYFEPFMAELQPHLDRFGYGPDPG